MNELPTTGDLAKLPRWALVAYGARCARRLERSATIILDEQGQRAFNSAIQIAERSAANAKALDVDEAVRASEATRKKTYDDVSCRGDDTDYAREFSASAHAASLAAQTVKEPKPHYVNLIIDEVDYVEGAQIRDDIVRDYRLVQQTAIEQGWNDITAVAPHIFAVAQDSVNLVLQAVRCLSDKLARLVSEDPNALDAIEWRDLERMLATVFDGIGFEVELTPASKDGGKDLIIKYWHNGRRKQYIVEIKHWRSGKLVGEKVLTDFVHVVARERRDGGLFLATYGYADNEVEIITEIQHDAVFVGEKPQIVSLCRSYVRANSGLWKSMSPLHEILHHEFKQLAMSANTI